jgi:hypothetical protein
MIAERALQLAGPGAVLAARPTGVAHVYTGPLTPSGRFIPRAGQAVCRARTRQLRVVPTPPGWSTLQCSQAGARRLPRLCARCSTCLSRRVPSPHGAASPVGRQVEQHPTSRAAYRHRFADLTPADLWVAAQLATTPEELAAVGHLSLVLFGHHGCTRPVTCRSGRIRTSLHQAISTRRKQLEPDEQSSINHSRARAVADQIRKDEHELTRIRRGLAAGMPR